MSKATSQDELLLTTPKTIYSRFSGPHMSRVCFQRLIIFAAYLILCFMALAYHLIDLSVGSTAQRTMFREMARSPETLDRLRAENLVLQDTIRDINNLSVNDLQKRISNISEILALAQKEMEAKKQGLEKIQTLVASGTDQYESLKNDITRLDALKEDQLKLAASILTRDQDSWWKYIGALSVSFIIGVLSSLIANHLWEQYLRKRGATRIDE